MDDAESLSKNELKVSLNPLPTCPEAKPTAPSDDGSSSSFAPAVGLCILALNCGVAMYHSRHDPRSVLFVAACFVNLALLFHLLRVFERLPRGSPRRLPVKAGVWALTTILTAMFAQRVAALMPAPIAVVVWAMAVATIASGFYMFFVWRDEASAEVATEKPASKAAEGP